MFAHIIYLYYLCSVDERDENTKLNLNPHSINVMDNYPMGAATDMNAPYNEQADIEVEVCVIMTVTKTVKIKAPHNFYEMSEKEKEEFFDEVSGSEQETFDGWETIEAYVEEE